MSGLFLPENEPLYTAKPRPRGFFLQNGHVTIIHGNVFRRLASLPADYFHAVITSPPYFGLRDYKEEEQFGLEETPQEYVAKMVELFREVWRVLHPTGTVWLNLGDTYAANRSYHVPQPMRALVDYGTANASRVPKGFKAKDLFMIPSRVAIALQEDGWYLRSHTIWHKTNPMPESAEDRPTQCHESLFLLTKNADYYYDNEAVKEVGTIPAGTLGAKGSEQRFNTPGVNSRPPEYKTYDGLRNCRNVWTMATETCSEAHFAVMPFALADRCVQAGTSEGGCCPLCRTPWISGKVVITKASSGHSRGRNYTSNPNRPDLNTEQITQNIYEHGEWQQSCSCAPHPSVPCTVLDPFGGTGTTADAAARRGRNAAVVELNAGYIDMMKRRFDAEDIPYDSPIIRRSARRT